MLDIFPEPTDMGLSALCFMMLVYGFILMRASAIMGDGCEMLVLLYGPGIVGGLVVPFLGAVPDCVVILLSGMGEGSTAEVQHQLSVGVGTLVGSTVMLLTVPWGLGVFLGRRDYDEEKDCAARADDRKPKLTHTSLTTNCVTALPEIPTTARIMMVSLVGYLIIQIPSFFCSAHADIAATVSCERPWALTCMICTGLAFFAYCWQQVRSSESAELERRHQEGLRRNQWKAKLDHSLGSQRVQELVFRSFDKDNSGYIEAEELSRALAHLGLQVGRKDIHELMESIDVGHERDGDAGRADGRVSLHEFQDAVSMWVRAGQNSEQLAERSARSRRGSVSGTPMRSPRKSPGPDGSSLRLKKDDIKSDISYGAMEIGRSNGNDDHEEEEQEEEYWDLSETELKMKACLLLLFGTLCVTIFSDPLVDVITQVGDRINVSPFYIAFVVTPFASNASEVYAGILFAKKKTNESISMTLATMHGAATLNSTLCLSIFMAIIYARGLEWIYTAEVLTVIVVVIAVGVQSMLRRNIFLWQGLLVLALYPLSIVLIWLLQSVAGLK